MLEYVLQFVFFLLSAYGFYALVVDLAGRFPAGKFKAGCKTGKGIRLYLAVKNGQDSIEGVVRTLLASQLPQSLTEDGCLNVVDCGSTDQTIQILQLLEREQAGLFLL